MLLITVTRTADELLRAFNIDDLERPSIPQKGAGLMIFYDLRLRFSRVSCDEMAGGLQTRTIAYEIFGIIERTIPKC